MSKPALQPVDIDHLNRYTGGDSALNGQILRLFDGQCQEILEKLEALVADPGPADLSKEWRDAAHSLKGAARGVGAFALADTAAEAEKTSMSDEKAMLAALDRLKANAATVHQFVDRLIASLL